MIEVAAFPILPATRVLATASDSAASDLALFGGEDYELLFTAPMDQAAAITVALPAATGTPATVIGTITAEPAIMRVDDGRGTALVARGWDHLHTADR